MNKKYEKHLIDRLQKSFMGVLDKDFVNMTKEDICAVLAFAGMRVFRTELAKMSKPTTQQSLDKGDK